MAPCRLSGAIRAGRVMSVQAMAWAIGQDIVSDPVARHVLLCLANYADASGGSAFPSVARLCADTGLSESTVRRRLSMLVSLGVIAVEEGSLLPMAKGIPADRRPQVYQFVHLDPRGVSQLPRAECDERGVCGTERGVTQHERGVCLTPKPSINHQVTEKQEQKHVQPSAAPCRFNEFWAAYPNKKSKREAEKSWKRQKLDSRCDELIAHVALMQATDDAWLRGYVPMGSTYLNQARWEDVPKAPPSLTAPIQGKSKTLTAIETLQRMKHGNLDSQRDSGRPEPLALPEPRTYPGG